MCIRDRHNPGFFDDFTCIGAEHYLYQEYSVSYKFFGYRIFKDGNKADDPLMNFWQGRRGGVNLFQGIRDCNIFLERIDEPIDLERYEKNRWGAEVKFLKAYYHFLLLQMYGPIPIVKENLQMCIRDRYRAGRSHHLHETGKRGGAYPEPIGNNPLQQRENREHGKGRCV